jgi:AcrR family transcriptional regulator
LSTGRAEDFEQMSDTDDRTGRYRQRGRTRAAIVEATTELLAAGRTPSVAEIADAADVSRRTVYLHFPTIEQLLTDATLGMLSQRAIDDAIDSADTGNDVEARVEAMVRAIGRLSGETLALGRSLIRLTVDTPASSEPGAPKRGYRRIAWIEKALEPLRDQISESGFERLVSALAMVVGWEALVVLEDLRGLDTDEQQDVSLWAAKALISATMREQDARAAPEPKAGR